MSTTTQPAKIPPFKRVLVPYDGSDPATGALGYAIAFGRAGSRVDLVHVVDPVAVLSSVNAGTIAFDPTPLLEALDEQARAILLSAQERCRKEGVDPTVTLLHDQPVPAIVAIAEKNGDDLIIMGTHGRRGLPRMFLGSTTEGVLRGGQMPVLAVRSTMHPPAGTVRKLLVAVDDSDPADAAAALAGRISRASGATCIFCHTIDTDDFYAKSATYGYDPQPFVDGLRSLGREIIARAQRSARFAESESSATIVEDKPVNGILAEAHRTGADAVVIGSHGRRGLQRLVLGSVAEHVVRQSPVPVFVVRSGASSDAEQGDKIARELAGAPRA